MQPHLEQAFLVVAVPNVDDAVAPARRKRAKARMVGHHIDREHNISAILCAPMALQGQKQITQEGVSDTKQTGSEWSRLPALQDCGFDNLLWPADSILPTASAAGTLSQPRCHTHETQIHTELTADARGEADSPLVVPPPTTHTHTLNAYFFSCTSGAGSSISMATRPSTDATAKLAAPLKAATQRVWYLRLLSRCCSGTSSLHFTHVCPKRSR